MGHRRRTWLIAIGAWACLALFVASAIRVHRARTVTGPDVLERRGAETSPGRLETLAERRIRQAREALRSERSAGERFAT